MRGLSSVSPFRRNGNTAKITANISGSLPTPIQVTQGTSTDERQYTITNVGNNDAWVADAATSALATSGAVIPTGDGANAKAVFPVLARSQVTISAATNAFFCAITASGTSDLYITPGKGA
jgi:hypothetical protein